VISPAVEAIRRILEERGVALIEDAAHAHGATLHGKPAGSFGVAAAFSFYPTKVVTSAEGGMILTDDECIAEEAMIYRDQGKAGFYGGEHVRRGYAWRLSELQAAVGLVQTQRLETVRQAGKPSPLRRGTANLPGWRKLSRRCRSTTTVRRPARRRRRPDQPEDGPAPTGNVRERRGLRPAASSRVGLAAGGGMLPVADDVCARRASPVTPVTRSDEVTRGRSSKLE
jgi:hypothetical protein